MRLGVMITTILGTFVIGALTALYFRPAKVHERAVSYGSVFFCTVPYSEYVETNVVAQLVTQMKKAGFRSDGDMGEPFQLCGTRISGKTSTFVSPIPPYYIYLTYGKIEGRDAGVVDLDLAPPKHYNSDYSKLLFDSRSVILNTMTNRLPVGGQGVPEANFQGKSD